MMAQQKKSSRDALHDALFGQPQTVFRRGPESNRDASCGISRIEPPRNLSLWGQCQGDSIEVMSDLDSLLTNAVLVARQFGASRLLLFGRALENPESAHDLDLACAGVPGWRLFELSSVLEETLRVPLDLVPLDRPTPFTRLIEQRGRVLL
jgi:uncharacterized protein